MRRANRRSFLTAFVRLLACLPFVNSRLLAAETFATLRQPAAEKGIRFGFAVDPAKLNDDAAYRQLVARHASIVVPENALKWQTVHPEPERYNFASADAIAGFAKAHEQRMRGHTFCWHRSLPDWIHQTVTPTNAEAVLTAHISTVASHYRGDRKSVV